MRRVEKEFMGGWSFALTNAGKTLESGLDWTCPPAEAFKSVTLPHDWAVTMPISEDMRQGADQGYRNRWGIGWYRKEFILEEIEENRRCLLDFGGIFEDSCIWVNGRELGGHRYGYTPFCVDVTEALREGTNEILVRVNNTAEPADRWYSGCGIYRTVKWIVKDEDCLEAKDVIVDTDTGEGDAKVRVRVLSRKRVNLVLCAPESGAPVAQGLAADGEWTELTVVQAKLWSAEHPDLYTLKLSLADEDGAGDEISLRIGLRRVEFLPGKGMFVNGRETKLKGACVHQDVGCLGIAAKKEIWRERLAALKEMGCNAIRPAHHMHSEEFMDLCDEMGFYVYEECFDKWTGGLYGRYFEDDWQKDIKAMIERDRNRPSVVIWGVGNEVENQGQPSMLDILRKLTGYVHALDGTRPVSCAMNPHFKRESNVDIRGVSDIQKFVDEVSDTEIYDIEERVERICRIGEIVDIISCNYQEQWYPRIHGAMPDKLILGTESYQYFSGYGDQMQNYTEENPPLTPFQYPWCIGSMIWTGIDYLGESMGYPSKGWCGSPIRTNGERRTGYYTLQSQWSEEPMVHFAVLDYSLGDEMVKEHWDAPMYLEHWDFPWLRRAVIPYRIATNCEEVALYLNGRRFYVGRPADFANGIITGYLPWQPGRVRAVGYRQGKEAACHEVATPGEAQRLAFSLSGRKETLPEEFALQDAEEGYELMLTVRALDGEGQFCMRTEAEVSFTVEGEAEFVAADNGDLCGDASYEDRKVALYRGSASVVICLKAVRGKTKVRAMAEGLDMAEVALRFDAV
jgi:beta-galactosidase